jgi:hypothetical protein
MATSVSDVVRPEAKVRGEGNKQWPAAPLVTAGAGSHRVAHRVARSNAGRTAKSWRWW